MRFLMGIPSQNVTLCNSVAMVSNDLSFSLTEETVFEKMASKVANFNGNLQY